MHPVLERQLGRNGLQRSVPPDPSAWTVFLDQVAAAYEGHDQDRYLLERSLTLSSREMGDLHAALRRDREQLAAVIDSLDRGLIVLNHELRVEIVNPEASRIIGAPLEELRTWTIHELRRCACDDAALAQVFDDVLPSGAPGRRVCDEGRLRGVGDRIVAVSASVIPIHHDQLMHSVVVVLSDISERQQMELMLRQSQKLEAVGRLAAGVAHEINTPMQFVGVNLVFVEQSVSSMMSVLEAVESLLGEGEWKGDRFRVLNDAMQDCDLKYLSGELPQALAESSEGVERVTAIVSAMRSFSHPGNASAASADLNQALRDTVTVARGELRGIAEVTLELTDLPPVLCTIHDLKQVFLNLVINAAHAIADRGPARPGPGTIVVASTCHDDYISITISDDGGGIADRVADHIFDPFFTTKEVGRGSGQGLALAHRAIVEGHHGKLSFATEVGVGTTFEIQLPVKPDRLGVAAIP